jgi:hypothetical protein
MSNYSSGSVILLIKLAAMRSMINVFNFCQAVVEHLDELGA